MYAVLGSPIHHSLSPQIFNLFSTQLSQPIPYQAIEVKLENLSASLKTLHQQGYKGVNLTAPLKEKAFSLAATLSKEARAAKAINVLCFQADGSYHGHNSDGLGFIRDLIKLKKCSIQGKTILILGAGGAVRGILPFLFQENPRQIIISNRSEAKARLLIEDCQPSALPLHFSPWEELSGPFDLVINGTTLGLQGKKPTLPDQILSKEACCYDLSYGNAALPFLSWAQAQGAPHCYDGLGMLVEQAAEALYLWRRERVETHPVIQTLISTRPEECP